MAWPLKFLHALDTGQVLPAHTAIRIRVPPKHFKGVHLKLGLKFHICAPITLGVVGVTSRFFPKVMWLIGGVITWTLILQGVPPIKFGRVRNVKNLAIFNNFRLWSQISPEWIDKSKVGKIRDQLHFIHYCEKKNLMNLGHKPKKYRRACWPTQLHFFRRLYFDPCWVLAPQIFTPPTSPINCISSRTWCAWWVVASSWALPHISGFFKQPQDLRSPSADRRETLHSDQYMRHLLMQVQKLGESSPKIFYPR